MKGAALLASHSPECRAEWPGSHRAPPSFPEEETRVPGRGKGLFRITACWRHHHTPGSGTQGEPVFAPLSTYSLDSDIGSLRILSPVPCRDTNK